MPFRQHDPEPGVVIGLVNNMPASAFRTAEVQFGCLLREAAARMRPRLRVQLRCFAVNPFVGSTCEGLDALWRSQLDALIVTGTPPQAEHLSEEPSLPLLARVADWAAANTDAALWSCFGAHAAVYHLDGLARRRLPAKLSGVFRCERASQDGLTSSAPRYWPVPHSRHYDLDAQAVADAGYHILSRGPGLTSGTDGLDSFETKVGRSWFLMLQGHPEYDASSLLREYRRDLRRAMAEGTGVLPALPLGSVTPAVAAKLRRSPTSLSTLAALDAVIERPGDPGWHRPAVALFQRWLAQIVAAQSDYACDWQLAAS